MPDGLQRLQNIRLTDEEYGHFEYGQSELRLRARQRGGSQTQEEPMFDSRSAEPQDRRRSGVS